MKDSLFSVCPDAELYLCCMESDMIMDSKLLPYLKDVKLITMAEIENKYLELFEIKKQRTAVEYYWTLTPFVIDYVYQKTNVKVTYLDSDLKFYSDPSSYIENVQAGVLLHRHRFDPHLLYLDKLSGTYNVGLIVFNRTESGKNILNWWKNRCFEWCFWKIEDGKMGDQMYLNDFYKHGEVYIEESKGFGLAPWNTSQYQIKQLTDHIDVSGDHLIFYHFHAFDVTIEHSRLKIIRSRYKTYNISNVLNLLYLPYIEEYKKTYEKVYGKIEYYAVI